MAVRVVEPNFKRFNNLVDQWADQLKNSPGSMPVAAFIPAIREPKDSQLLSELNPI